MNVSVIIPAYNEEKYIAACLESLIEQKVPADEIILVDNNSTDKTVEIAKKYPIRIVHEKKQGMTYSRNKGFNTAKYEIIARTDADTKVATDWIKRIKKDFADKHVIAVSGPARFHDRISDTVTIIDLPHKILFFKLLKQALHHDCLFGPNMAIRKSAWEKIKDEVCLEDKEVHEDIDLSIHLAPYGKIKFDNKLIVYSSLRKFKQLTPYIEYPYRSLKTIRRHKKTLLEMQSKKLVKSVLHRSKTIMKQLQQLPQ